MRNARFFSIMDREKRREDGSEPTWLARSGAHSLLCSLGGGDLGFGILGVRFGYLGRGCERIGENSEDGGQSYLYGEREVDKGRDRQGDGFVAMRELD